MKFFVDTADTAAIKELNDLGMVDGVTTNPSLITAAAGLPQYQSIVDETLQQAKETLGAGASDQAVAKEAFKHLAVAFGKKILEIVPGIGVKALLPAPSSSSFSFLKSVSNL